MKTKVVLSKRFKESMRVSIDDSSISVDMELDSFLNSLASVVLPLIVKQASETIGNPLLLATNAMATSKLETMSLDRFKSDLVASSKIVISEMKNATIVAE